MKSNFFSKLGEKRNKLRKFAHIVAGVVILIHSYERYENGHSTYLFFALAGLLFLSVAILHHQLQHKYPKIDFIFFMIEGVLSFIVAFEYISAGKKFLPFAYFIAGLLQFFSIYFFSKKLSRTKNDLE